MSVLLYVCPAFLRDNIMSLELEKPVMNANTTPAATPSFAMDMDALGRSKRNMNMADEDICLETKHLDLFYGQKQALFDVNMTIPRKRVTAFIGRQVVVNRRYCVPLTA